MRSPGIRLHKLALFGWAVVITAVLLLLSLPVLAGKVILPALNSAVCWKQLYYLSVTLSAGNKENFNFFLNPQRLHAETYVLYGMSYNILILQIISNSFKLG